MNKQIPLNLTGEWEDIVNNVARHNARCRFEQIRKRNKLNKMLNQALCWAMTAALATILSFTGLLSVWVAACITIPCLGATCFIGGRIWDRCHK